MKQINTTIFKYLLSSLMLFLFLMQGQSQIDYSSPFQGKEMEIGNLLEWGVEADFPGTSFVIEKSEDGENFDQIGIADQPVLMEDEKKYRFLDFRKESDKMFYRIKYVDQGGAANYSSLVVLNKTKANDFMVVKMSDTHTFDYFDFVIDAFQEGELTYKLINSDKETVFETKTWLIYGLNELSISMASEPQGSYKVLLNMREENEELKIFRKANPVDQRNTASKH